MRWYRPEWRHRAVGLNTEHRDDAALTLLLMAVHEGDRALKSFDCAAMAWMDEIGRPVLTRRLPGVPSAQEVAAVLAELDGVHGLLARLLYGTGLRIEEAPRLSVKDLDFAHQAILKTIAGPVGQRRRYARLAIPAACCRLRDRTPPQPPRRPGRGAFEGGEKRSVGVGARSALRELTRRRCPSTASHRRAARVRRRDPDASIAAESARRADRPTRPRGRACAAAERPPQHRHVAAQARHNRATPPQRPASRPPPGGPCLTPSAPARTPRRPDRS